MRQHSMTLSFISLWESTSEYTFVYHYAIAPMAYRADDGMGRLN